MPINIAINGRFLTQDLTGVQRYAVELVTAIDDLLSLDQESTKNLRVELLAPKKKFKIHLDLKRIKIKRVGFFGGHLWEQLLFPFFSARYDWILNLGNTASLLNLVFHRRVCVTVHDLSYIYYPNAYSFAFKSFYRVITPLIFRFASKIITVSQSEKSKMAEFFPSEKIFPIHSGVPRLFQESKYFNEEGRQPRSPYTILFVGSVSHRKNIGGLIEACKILKEKGMEFVLKIVAAKNSSFSDFEIPDLSWIEWVETRSDRDLIELYRSADIFVLPSYYESFGFPGLEAMSQNLPVVASNTPALMEIYRDAALYFDPRSPKEICEKIETVLRDQALRSRLELNASKILDCYSWDRCARQYLNTTMGVAS